MISLSTFSFILFSFSKNYRQFNKGYLKIASACAGVRFCSLILISLAFASGDRENFSLTCKYKISVRDI